MAQVPTGSIISVANISPPPPIDGFLLCDGTSKNKSDYPVLYDCFYFDDIQYTSSNYGIVDSENFNVPNLVNYFPCMDTNINNLGETYGSNQILLHDNNTPQHTHNINYSILHSHIGTSNIINLESTKWATATTYGEGIGGDASDGPPYILKTSIIPYISNNTTTSVTPTINIQLKETGTEDSYDITNSYIKINYYIKY